MKRTFTEKDQKELEDGVISEIDEQNEPEIKQGGKMNTCKTYKYYDEQEHMCDNIRTPVVCVADFYGCVFYDKKETPCCGICIEMTKADKTGH